MSNLESISRVRPVSAPQSLVEALHLEDTYWDYCVIRAGQYYGHSFSDHGFETATVELKIDRKATRLGLEFDYRYLFEYEHRFSIDDPGLSGSVYVLVPSALTFIGSVTGLREGLILDYRLCLQASSIHGFVVDTKWEPLGDQSVHVLFTETIIEGAIATDSTLLKDLFKNRTLRDFDYRQFLASSEYQHLRKMFG